MVEHDNSAPPAKKSRPRKMTERRKEQNRIAQRVFRAKQKRLRDQRKSMQSDSALSLDGFHTDDSKSHRDSTRLSSPEFAYPEDHTFPAFGNPFDFYFPQALDLHQPYKNDDAFHQSYKNDDAFTQTCSNDSDSSLHDVTAACFAPSLPAARSVPREVNFGAYPQQCVRSHSVSDAGSAGALDDEAFHEGSFSLDDLAQAAQMGRDAPTHSGQFVPQHVLQTFPDCRPAERLPQNARNSLQMESIDLVSACRANSRLLGVDTLGLMDAAAKRRGYPSPFHRLYTQLGDASAVKARYQATKPDLRPTAAQILCAHDIYIDLIPFPAFRDKVLALLSLGPTVFNEHDFKRDLEMDGIVCWGTNDSWTPWDKHSWEVKPWFLRKWWIITGGTEGEMYQSSKWYWDQRGEKHHFDLYESAPPAEP